MVRSSIAFPVSPMLCPRCGNHRTRVIHRTPAPTRILCLACGRVSVLIEDDNGEKASRDETQRLMRVPLAVSLDDRR